MRRNCQSLANKKYNKMITEWVWNIILLRLICSGVIIYWLCLLLLQQLHEITEVLGPRACFLGPGIVRVASQIVVITPPPFGRTTLSSRCRSPGARSNVPTWCPQVGVQTIEPVPTWQGEWLFCPISSPEQSWVQLSDGYHKLQGIKVVDQLARDRDTTSATRHGRPGGS